MDGLAFWLLVGVVELWMGLVLGLSGFCRCGAAAPGLSKFHKFSQLLCSASTGSRCVSLWELLGK